MNNNHIFYQILKSTDLHSNSLKNFRRYQETNHVWYKDLETNQYILKADYFVENWDDLKKEQVVTDLHNCIQSNGIVVAALANGEIIGFANVEGEPFGTFYVYRELVYIHVSNEYRNKGIGRKLFQLCCEEAKAIGTAKLYIAAHPSDETQHFYRSMGCVYAVEINQEILAKEPLDIQLEYCL
jgi:ribosomal protein S18 acetylase RimI-like enzyme